jgi:hypothetical protein
MKYTTEDQREYAEWLRLMISRESAKQSSIFTLINIYGLSKDLANTELNLNNKN